MMPTDEERREVARRLREMSGWGGEVDCAEWGERVLNLLYRGGEDCTDGEYYARLADLIDPDTIPAKQDKTEHPLSEPVVDRERLLAIAGLMAADSVRSAKKGSSVSPVYILHAARNIAEACGETFGSIRNRDLTKWGVSIVPKEASEDFAGCARRIREALGVSDG